MATEPQLPGPHTSPSDTRDGHFGGEHRLLRIFDTASLKGEHSYLGENSKSYDHENTIVVRRIENQQSHGRRGIMRRTQRLRFRDEEEEDGETLERRVLFFREVPRHIEDRSGPHRAAGDNEVRSAECDQNV